MQSAGLWHDFFLCHNSSLSFKNPFKDVMSIFSKKGKEKNRKFKVKVHHYYYKRKDHTEGKCKEKSVLEHSGSDLSSTVHDICDLNEKMVQNFLAKTWCEREESIHWRRHL